eukprot:jgi/Mesen1/1684/ME000137S00600
MKLHPTVIRDVGPGWILFSLSVATLLAVRGFRKRSLSASGALAGLVVTFITMLCGFRFGLTLIVFYLSSSRLTKFKAAQKALVEDGYKEGGQRDWLQVLANSATATVLCAVFAALNRFEDRCFDARTAPLETALLGGFLGHYAACAGDTWASELGIVATAQPRLVTSGRRVPPGTNGGVTGVGTLASALGGCLMGVCFFLAGLATATHTELGCNTGLLLPRQVAAIPLAVLAGVLGSLIDSLLGATLQYSGFDDLKKKVVESPGPLVKRITGRDVLGNNAVNFLSVGLTAAITAGIAVLIF